MTLAEIKATSPQAARAYVLCIVEGCSQREAGKTMGISEITVSTHVNRCKRMLNQPTARPDPLTDEMLAPSMRNPCARCGLHGAHECMPTVYELASARTGASYGEF